MWSHRISAFLGLSAKLIVECVGQEDYAQRYSLVCDERGRDCRDGYGGRGCASRVLPGMFELSGA